MDPLLVRNNRCNRFLAWLGSSSNAQTAGVKALTMQLSFRIRDLWYRQACKLQSPGWGSGSSSGDQGRSCIFDPSHISVDTACGAGDTNSYGNTG